MFEWINDNSYTCPVLMKVQGWIRRQKWSYGCDGWVLLSRPNVRARCQWPRWMILSECWLWNSRAGIRLRVFCGSNQQRESRLRAQQKG